MKKISLLLIIFGVTISAYPFLERGYTWYMQQKILQEYESQQGIGMIQEDKTQEDTREEDRKENAIEYQEYYDLQEIFEEKTRQELKVPQGSVRNEEETQQMDNDQEENPTVQKENHSNKKTKAIGIIKINKINLNLPILKGATEKNLKIGVGLVMGTTPLGEIGNTALAGHRSHTYGRFFNRLDELEVGDQILIEEKGKILQYEVYKKHIVGPENTYVLNRNNKDQILTLITCHPLYTSTHRLVIHAIHKT